MRRVSGLGKALADVIQQLLGLGQVQVGDEEIKGMLFTQGLGFLHRAGQKKFPKAPELDHLGKELPAPIVLIHHQNTAPMLSRTNGGDLIHA